MVRASQQQHPEQGLAFGRRAHQGVKQRVLELIVDRVEQAGVPGQSLDEVGQAQATQQHEQGRSVGTAESEVRTDAGDPT